MNPEAMAMLGNRGELTPREAAEASIPFNYAPSTPRERIEEDWAVRLPLAATNEGYLAQLSGTSQWDGYDRLDRVTTPTLVVHGELDALVPPENGRILAERIPGAELVTVPHGEPPPRHRPARASLRAARQLAGSPPLNERLPRQDGPPGTPPDRVIRAAHAWDEGGLPELAEHRVDANAVTEATFAVLALLVLGWAVVSGVLARANINGPLVFTVAGFALANPGWGPLTVNFEAPSIHVIAEVTLALLLFADASRVNIHKLRRDVRFPARLLGIGLPLSVVLGSLLAAWFFDDLSWALAGFVGATLSPTDAALSAQVINDKRIPMQVRRVLNVESGLNDGIVTPIVAFTLAIAASELGIAGDHHVGRGGALLELAVGVLIGLAVGLGSAGLLKLGTRRSWIVPGGRRLGRLARPWAASHSRSPSTAMGSSAPSWQGSPSARDWMTRLSTRRRSASCRSCWARSWRSSSGSCSARCSCRSPSTTSTSPSWSMHC